MNLAKFKLFNIFIILFLLSGCGGGGGSSPSSSTNTSTTTNNNTTTTSTTTIDTSDSSIISNNCNGTTDVELAICAANLFLNTLTSSEKASVVYDWTDVTAKTRWINLPVSNYPRSGIRFDKLSDESLTAALNLAKTVLSEAGYEDFTGLRAADDYLNSLGSNGYGANLYYIAIIGTPSISDNWMIMLGGHHMAYNITFLSQNVYPTPNFAGAEPKGSFEISSTTYSPLKDEGDAMVAMFDGLSSSELNTAYLSGETYSDVLAGPEYELGYNDTSRFSVSNRGLAVSQLSDSQKELVVTSIKQWVNDYASDFSSTLLAEYTSDDALNNTYIAWAGSQTLGIDVDTSGTYMRIDGPRFWLEIVCQNGVVINNQTHYHAVFRDKDLDYGNSL